MPYERQSPLVKKEQPCGEVPVDNYKTSLLSVMLWKMKKYADLKT